MTNFYVGRAVKIRVGREWVDGVVNKADFTTVHVATQGGPVYVHRSGWARDLRVGSAAARKESTAWITS